jgi:hypothetical protein
LRGIKRGGVEGNAQSESVVFGICCLAKKLKRRLLWVLRIAPLSALHHVQKEGQARPEGVWPEQVQQVKENPAGHYFASLSNYRRNPRYTDIADLYRKEIFKKTFVEHRLPSMVFRCPDTVPLIGWTFGTSTVE